MEGLFSCHKMKGQELIHASYPLVIYLLSTKWSFACTQSASASCGGMSLFRRTFKKKKVSARWEDIPC